MLEPGPECMKQRRESSEHLREEHFRGMGTACAKTQREESACRAGMTRVCTGYSRKGGVVELELGHGFRDSEHLLSPPSSLLSKC